LRYEEQQRKLMKELMAEQEPYSYEELMKITTHGSEEDEDDDGGEGGGLSEWRKISHDRQYAINRSFREERATTSKKAR
jgi:hypothetical protein